MRTAYSRAKVVTTRSEERSQLQTPISAGSHVTVICHVASSLRSTRILPIASCAHDLATSTKIFRRNLFLNFQLTLSMNVAHRCLEFCSVIRAFVLFFDRSPRGARSLGRLLLPPSIAAVELDGLSRILEMEGVTVRRPDVRPGDFNRPVSTPDFESKSQLYAAMPRDVLITVSYYAVGSTAHGQRIHRAAC